MARPLTYRRHGRHRSYARLNRRTDSQASPGLGQDAQRFVDDQDSRLGDTAEGSEGIFDSMHLEQDEDEFFTFDQVREASDPSDIGLTSSGVQTTSLDYGAGAGTQALENTSHNILGIADEWSLGFWIKPVLPIPSLLRIWRLAPVSSNNDFVTISFDNLGGGNRFMSDLIDEDNSGTGTNNRTWDGFLNGLDGLWTHILLTFVGSVGASDPTIIAYRNGVFVSSTSGSAGGSGAPRLNQSDRARRIESLGNDGGSRSIGGILAQAQLWRVDVGSAAAFLADPVEAASRDLNTNSGAYTFAGDLAHWWKPGAEAEPNLGKDFATGFAEIVDLSTVINLSDSDRVADVPS